jgi:hypothetical protein
MLECGSYGHGVVEDGMGMAMCYLLSSGYDVPVLPGCDIPGYCGRC